MSGLPSWLIRETERNDRHVYVSIFVGPDADHRALAGRLILDHDQFADLTMIFGGSDRKRVNLDSAPVDGPVRYLDLDTFYASRPDRERSPEVDFGVMWTDGPSWPHYRVSWVENTGEVYAIRLLPGGSGKVELLGAVLGRDEIEETLAGWAEIEPMTLDWIRKRLET